MGGKGMKDLLTKLQILFTNQPHLKDEDRVILVWPGGQITYKELYELYEFVNEFKDMFPIHAKEVEMYREFNTKKDLTDDK